MKLLLAFFLFSSSLAFADINTIDYGEDIQREEAETSETESEIIPYQSQDDILEQENQQAAEEDLELPEDYEREEIEEYRYDVVE